MNADRYRDICHRMRGRCRQWEWYGPDGGWEDQRGYFDEEGNLKVRVIEHDPHSGFEFPPASEEQLRATEEALGIPLLPMLRALYRQVANGGFGPANGITGARGGYSFGDDGRYQTVDRCTDSDPLVQSIDLSEYEQAHGQPASFKLRPTLEPAHFLHLCYEGCGMDICIDGNSGRVYRTAPCGSLPDSFVPNWEWVPEATIGYWRVADSLEDWLEGWLSGETQDPFE